MRARKRERDHRYCDFSRQSNSNIFYTSELNMKIAPSNELFTYINIIASDFNRKLNIDVYDQYLSHQLITMMCLNTRNRTHCIDQ